MREYCTAEKGSRLAECASIADLSNFVRTLRSLADPYRPELHYMRGPGPKWHAKHASADRSWRVERPVERNFFKRTLRFHSRECEWVRQEFAGRSRDLIMETKEKRR